MIAATEPLKRLNILFKESQRLNISNEDKIVIFSDLHLGNGRFNDDFSSNSILFKTVLRDYYLKRNYKLILNGDIEELYKFSLTKIENKWKEIYEIFDEFDKNGNFFKIFGNHDFALNLKYKHYHKYKLYEGLRLEYLANSLFIYHGHQAAGFRENYSRIIMFLIRYLLRIFRNDSIPMENRKKYKTEIFAYNFSTKNKIVSILGHTHRPLFESLSKIESLKMLIENLINRYQKSLKKDKSGLENQIKSFKNELVKLYERNYDYNVLSSLYNTRLLVPCLFNSGAVTGKRGMTGLEIKNGKIYLIYWFDRKRSLRYLHYKNVKSRQFNDTDFYKAILRKDCLNNIFSRIHLLC